MTVQEWLGEDNQIGIDIWEKKYRYNNETFDEWLDRISAGDDDVRQLIIEKKFLFGGRILANRGLEKKGVKVTLSNCYVIKPVEDNIESIFDCAKQLARTFSYGGGCGIDVGGLRPKGAPVNNAAKETSGAVSFMDLYSIVTEIISQNGRRGALMISIPCTHPDLEEFIDCKKDLERCTKANISIRITDDFMKAVNNKETFTLSFDNEDVHITKDVDAYKLFYKICENNWLMAEPGCLFWDKIENYNLLSEDKDFHYAGVNPCVSGDTLVLTEFGYKPIIDLCGQEVNIWNGYQFSAVTPRITGKNQPMVKVSLSDGNILNCTKYHKFILSDGNRVVAEHLKIGDKLIKCDFPIINCGKDVDRKIMYTSGFFMGDGNIELDRKSFSIKLYGEKRKLIDFLTFDNINYCKSFNGDFVKLPYYPEYFNKNFVPDCEYSINSRLNWLAGYIDSDGTINSSDGSVSISSVNKEVLLKVKYMLNTLGCNTKVTKMYDASYRVLPKNNPNNDNDIYWCKKSYRLLISAHSMSKLIKLGLKCHRISMPTSTPNRDASRFITIINIEDNGICDTVYCFTEPNNHSGIFNGVITAQCAEEPLPAYGSCLLGALNLAEFVDKNGYFNFSEFLEAVESAVLALNNVLDEGLPLHPLQEQRDSVGLWRQIGLGIMGLADMLIKMKIRYGSAEAVNICDRIGFVMANVAIATSAELAIDNDVYPYYKNCVMDSQFFKNNTSPTTKESVKEYGLYNSQLLTIAPTGTISTMIGVSGGIEPIFANSYNRTTKSLHGKEVTYKVYTPIVKKYMEENNITDEANLPDYFITSQNLNYKDRINMQSVWQKHIDASISSTINLPHETTIEDVINLYTYAWEKGCKGVTIYRDGCQRTGILTTNKTDKDKGTSCHHTLQRGGIIDCTDDLVGKKRKITTGCGSLHILAFFDPVNGDLQEVYLNKGSTGGCQNFMIGLSRTISLLCRAGVDIYTIKDQLDSTGTCPSYATRRAVSQDTSKGSCCPMAIGNALIDMYKEMLSDITCDESEKDEQEDTQDGAVYDIEDKITLRNNGTRCPECGELLVFEGGCNTCKSCGHSKCD